MFPNSNTSVEATMRTCNNNQESFTKFDLKSLKVDYNSSLNNTSQWYTRKLVY